MAWAWPPCRDLGSIDAYEPVAANYASTGPSTTVMRHDPIGPFSAYPTGKPRTPCCFSLPESRPNVAPFSLIEKSPAGGFASIWSDTTRAHGWNGTQQVRIPSHSLAARTRSLELERIEPILARVVRRPQYRDIAQRR